MCAWGGRALGAKGVTRALSKLKLQHTHPQDVTALCGKRQTAFTRDIRAGVLPHSQGDGPACGHSSHSRSLARGSQVPSNGVWREGASGHKA